MNKRLWKLLQLNVIYTNGKVAANKKGRTQSLNSAFYTMLASYPIVFGLALFMAFRTYSIWKMVPEMFFYQSGNMLLMIAGLIIFYSFSTFFKSRDFEQYLYYTYTKAEVFYGKTFAVFFMFSPFLFLVGAIGFSFGLAAGGIVAALIQFILSVAISIFVFLLVISFVFYIGTHRFLKKFGSILMGAGMVVFLVTMIIFSGSIGGIIGGSIAGEEGILFQSMITQIPVLNTYYQIIQTQPLLLLVLAVVANGLCVGNFVLLKKRAVRKYLQNVFSDTNVKKNVKTNYTQRTPQKALWKHNVNIVTANKQYVLMFIYMQILPIMMFVFPALGLGGVLRETFQSMNGVALMMLGGIGIVITSSMYSVSENMYSLERENLDYMISLPLTKKRIFQSKQYFSLVVTMIPFILYTVVLSIVLQVHPLNTIAFMISAFVFNYIYQTYYLLQDEKNPNVNWSSEMDLLQGGMQSFLRVIRFYGLIILFTVLIFIFFFTTTLWMLEMICIILLYVVLLYLIHRYKSKRHL